MVHIKCTLFLCCVSLVELGISANDEKNEAFAEDILALRQELNDLKQKFLLQEQEIKRLKQNVAKPLNPNREQDILFSKDQAIMDLNNQQPEKSRQARLLLHPTTNTSTSGIVGFYFHCSLYFAKRNMSFKIIHLKLIPKINF